MSDERGIRVRGYRVRVRWGVVFRCLFILGSVSLLLAGLYAIGAFLPNLWRFESISSLPSPVRRVVVGVLYVFGLVAPLLILIFLAKFIRFLFLDVEAVGDE